MVTAEVGVKTRDIPTCTSTLTLQIFSVRLKGINVTKKCCESILYMFARLIDCDGLINARKIFATYLVAGTSLLPVGHDNYSEDGKGERDAKFKKRESTPLSSSNTYNYIICQSMRKFNVPYCRVELLVNSTHVASTYLQ